ncbi:DUF302 domain-containing protein [Photobacterium sanguinicancri]|uniref:DUF302 domain-containing protein n=1 Tax=Photobacterium sanguinicancri TaxID=875932 RepID=A0ABX4FWV9_9GAMM|nr:DUF302 domain-containing protein [Photobacterium sanguinicancri]OZS43246.1 hypothetical protein ASV53_14175 [Photobacterium sanguinicancri]
MGKYFIGGVLAFVLSTTANADNGLITLKSSLSVNETADKFEKVAQEKGMVIFARIDHAQRAEKVGVTLRPTQLVIFGNPKVGSPLMACSQGVAIDLPQKVIVTEDENKQVWLTYNDPQYLVNRHNIRGCDAVIEKVSKALTNFAKSATQ